MRRSLVLLVSLAAVLAVGACQTTASPPPVPAPSDNAVVKWITTVQDITANVCDGFIPDSDFLLSLYKQISGNDYLAYAREICDALKKPQGFSGRRSATPRVRGVVIRGHWS